MNPTLQEAIHALKERPDDPDALAAYGRALVEAGRTGAAEGPIRKAIEKKPDHPARRTRPEARNSGRWRLMHCDNGLARGLRRR